MQQIKLEDGKYIIKYNESTSELLIYRHGELWRNHTGDKFMYAVFAALSEGISADEVKRLQSESYELGYDKGYEVGYPAGNREGYNTALHEAFESASFTE